MAGSCWGDVVPGEDLEQGGAGDVESGFHLIEISHRHDVSFLRKVHSFIGDKLLEKLLSVPATPGHHFPRLIKPMLLFDKSEIALSFLPDVAEYTYHHLRTQLHTMLIETGMAIDTCYTAPIAHITIARFVEGTLFTPFAGGLGRRRKRSTHGRI
ncbi:hypothetical protein DL546_001881 [Coniochaeta pulveracea]|uniref:Uncharacterized protein n=1 Tax=Coniochaeta pulveracea TaxID=177199 RepID=A0A420Y0J6_9PEZI|nr:hypothetical protein DL546_001881 [Coniochaeta pulveracea]